MPTYMGPGPQAPPTLGHPGPWAEDPQAHSSVSLASLGRVLGPQHIVATALREKNRVLPAPGPGSGSQAQPPGLCRERQVHSGPRVSPRHRDCKRRLCQIISLGHMQHSGCQGPTFTG